MSPPVTSTDEPLDTLTPPATTSSVSPTRPTTPEPEDISMSEPADKCNADPEDTSTSSPDDTRTDRPPTDTSELDAIDTSPSADTPRDPVWKPKDPVAPVDTCNASAAVTDTRPLTKLALSPANADTDPPALKPTS